MTSSFRVGTLEIKAYSDGTITTPPDVVLNVDRDEVEALLGGGDDVTVPVHNFLFARAGKLILIDAGSGPARRKEVGRLPEALQADGLDPSAIDVIVLTHLHPDHADGLIGMDGEAIFPNAEILLHAREYEFWMGEGDGRESEKLQATRRRNQLNIKPYLERTKLMRDGDEYLGCTPILAAGHSPGHTCWRIMSGSASFVAWGDLVHLSDVQIAQPNAAVTFDIDKELATKARWRMLDMLASERVMVAGAHIQGSGFGYIVPHGTSFAFEPGDC